MKKFTIPLLLLIIFLAWVAFRENAPAQIQATLIGVPAPDAAGFARAEGPLPLTFPADQGPHPDYLTEWWYYTGNLDTPDGQHFGFQLTFFRRALVPPAERPAARASAWAADQVYLAHFALTDVNGEQFHSFERYARGAAGLAGAQASPYRVWLENWSVEEIAPDQFHLLAAEANLQLDLELSLAKPLILHGDQGYSQKGPEPGNASIYISQTRLEARGQVTTARGTFPLTGLAWMDHEYSTSALSDGQIGWDWFSVQLSNHTELMFFQLRRADGTVDPFSSGTVIYADGTTRPLAREDFTITVLNTWRSPRTEADYPARWQVEIPSENLTLTLEPWLPDQELQTSVIYWEGAVRVTGTASGQPLTGNGYVELTGYAEAFDGDF
ncbi:MAG: lipocalin-like domain-containing protein [Anaerolineales bacterium]